MKKFITLALVLVFVLSMAAPAFAFTGKEWEGDAALADRFELAGRLVDVEEGYVTVNFLAPSSTRGYLKNEMVCAVFSLWVGKKEELNKYFSKLTFSGTNVSVWQDENFRGARNDGLGNLPRTAGGGWGMLNYLSKNAYTQLSKFRNSMPFFYAEDMAVNNYIRLNKDALTLLYNKDAAQTYYFAIFARVIADGATVTAKLSGGEELCNAHVIYAKDVADRANIGLNDDQLDLRIAALPEDAWYWTTANADDPALFDFHYEQLCWTEFNDDYEVALYDTNEIYGNLSSPATAKPIGNDLVGAGEIGYYVRYNGGVRSLNDYLFLIVTNSKNVCKRMYIFDPRFEVYSVNVQDSLYAECAWEVTVNNYDEWVFSANDETFAGYEGAIKASRAAGSLYKNLAGVVDEVVVADFQLDPGFRNGVMKNSWWNDAMGNNLFVEVAIEPWYAEITVPPEIEVAPPKTGDAMNILGFVMIALAGLAVVAVRKVRA